MKKSILILLTVITLTSLMINNTQAWPFGNTDERLNKLIDIVMRLQEHVDKNDNIIEGNIKIDAKNMEVVIRKLNEVISKLNDLLVEKDQDLISSIYLDQKEI